MHVKQKHVGLECIGRLERYNKIQIGRLKD